MKHYSKPLKEEKENSMKDRIKYAATFLAAFAIALLAGCGHSEDSTVRQSGGKVQVTISTGEVTERTALPSGAGFTKYTLKFTDNGSTYSHVNVDTTTGGASVELEEGNWTIDVDAYVDAELSGTGSKTVTIAPPVATVQIAINTIDVAGVAQGTLSFAITLPADDSDHAYSAPSVTITTPAGGAVDTIADTTLTPTKDLDPGVYFATVIVKDSVQRTQVAKTEAVHIYQGLTTTLGSAISISADEFTASIPVTGTATAALSVTAQGIYTGGITARQVGVYKDVSGVLTALDTPVAPGGLDDFILFVASADSAAVYIRQDIQVAGQWIPGKPTGPFDVHANEDDVGHDAGATADTFYAITQAAATASQGSIDVGAGAVLLGAGGNGISLTLTATSPYVIKSVTTPLSTAPDVSPTGTSPTFTFTMPAGDIEVTPFFVLAIPFLIVGPEDKFTDATLEAATSTSISYTTSETVTFEVTGTSTYTAGSNLQWQVDGVDATSDGSNASITIEARDYNVGVHTLTALIQEGGSWYSGFATFTVTE